MNYLYPKKGTNLDERASAPSSGNYPLSSFNTWHGGRHVEGALSELVAISDARIIGYKIPEKYLETEHKCPQVYSNGFIMLQHDCKSPEGQELTFYTMYSHIASKENMEGTTDAQGNKVNHCKIPLFLSKVKSVIKAKSIPKGVRGRSATLEEGKTRGKEIVLIPQSFKLTRNNDNTIAEWAKKYNEGKSKGKYHSYQYKDPFTGIEHTDIYVHDSCFWSLDFRKGIYKVNPFGKEDNTHSEQRNKLVKTAPLYSNLEVGTFIYNNNEDKYCTGFISNNTSVIKLKDTLTKDKNWIQLKDYEGYVRIRDIEEVNEYNEDEVKFDTAIACNIPVKAGEVIGYVGKFGYTNNEHHYTSHIDLVTDASDQEVKNFLTNIKEDGTESFTKYKLKKDTKLEPFIKSKKELKAGTPVKVSAVSGDYVRVKVKLLIKELTNGTDIWVQGPRDSEGNLKTDAKGKNIYYRDKLPSGTKDYIRYKIKEDRFEHVNKIYNGLLAKDSYLYLDKPLEKMQRRTIFAPKYLNQEFWIDKSCLKLEEGQTATFGLETTLESDSCHSYIGEPQAVDENGNTFQKEIELTYNPTKIQQQDDDGATWYFIGSSYNIKDKRYKHTGYLKADDTHLELINPFNWDKFGFKTFDAGSEYVYAVKDYHKSDATDKFIDEAWKMIDTDGDGVLTPMELLVAQRNPTLSERLGKMVVKHKLEWSYKYQKIVEEAKEFYTLGISSEKDPDRKKQLEKERDEDLEHLAKKVEGLMWWEELQNAVYRTKTDPKKEEEYQKKKKAIDDRYKRYSIDGHHSAECQSFIDANMDVLDQEYKKGIYKEAETRKLPATDMLWHFNVNSFVRQMRAMYPQGGNVCESLIWGEKLNCTERKKVIQIAEKLNLGKNKLEGANWLMAVMALETEGTFNHQTDNGIGYVGLIQFGAAAASDLKTTTKKLVAMSRLEQLDYVEKWIGRKKDKIKCLTDVYLSVLLPNSTGKGNEKDHVLWTSDREAYYNNPAFHKEKEEWKTLSHRGKFDKKGKKILKRGFKEKGTTYMWEVTKEIERWYTDGNKKKNDCTKGNCSLGNKIESDLDIQAGVSWLETLAVTKANLDSSPNSYKVDYVQESGSKAHLRSESTESALKKMDCSELVCRFLNKIGWSSDIKKYTTLDLKNLANKHPEWLKEQSKDYKPKVGDIFLWRTHKGHTGVIVEYNQSTDSVTTIEAISENEYPSRTNRGENSGHEGYNFRGVIKWKWNKRTGRHLIGHKSDKCRFYTPNGHYKNQKK